MLRFFRLLRYNLLNQHKLGKYFLYAIGEIFLVVIGILIALQINNWNDARRTKKQMKSYLISFKEDLKRDTTNFTISIKGYKKILGNKKLLKKPSLNNIPLERMGDLITPTTVESRPTLTTYTKITNSNFTKISNNDSLSSALHWYYTTGLGYFNDMLNFENESTKKDYEYWYYEQNLFEIEILEFPNFQTIEQRGKGLLKLISEPQGRNFLKLEYERKKRMANFYEDFKTIATELIIAIDKELAKNK